MHCSLLTGPGPFVLLVFRADPRDSRPGRPIGLHGTRPLVDITPAVAR